MISFRLHMVQLEFASYFGMCGNCLRHSFLLNNSNDSYESQLEEGDAQLLIPI